VGRDTLLIVVLLAGLVAVLFAMSAVGLEALSTVRAYVSEAGRWTAAQREAAYSLTRYARSRNEADYKAWLEAMQTPIEVRNVIIELRKEAPNLEAARRGLVRAGTDPRDVNRMIRLFRYTSRWGRGGSPARAWDEAEMEFGRLQALAGDLHREIATGSPSEVRVTRLLAEIQDTNDRLVDLEEAFTREVSDTSRSVRRFVLRATLLGAIALILIGALLIARLMRRLRNYEVTLVENEERYRSVVENAGEVIFQLDIEGRFTLLNPAWTVLTGYGVEESLGHHFTEYARPEEREQHQNTFTDMIAQKRRDWRLEAGVLTQSGGLRWVDARSQLEQDPEGRIVGVSGTLADVTARKQAEEEIQSRARQQSAISELGQRALEGKGLAELLEATVGVVATTLDVEFCKVLKLHPDGREFTVLAGTGWREEVVGSLTMPADAATQAGYTLQTMAPVVVDDIRTETRFRGAPFLHDHAVVSGVTVPIVTQGRPYGVLGAHTASRRTFTGDHVQFLQSVAHVLSIAIERASAEEALRKSESRFRELTEQASDGILIADDEAVLLEVNTRICELSGYRRDELVGMNALAFFPPEELAVQPPRLGEIREGHTVLSERRLVRKDGSRIPVEINTKLLRDGRILAIVRDITTRKETETALREREEELRQSQKMDALGRVAGGVAHDFNNLLTAIIGFTDFASARSGFDPVLKEYLEEIRRAGQRAAGLILQLLAFSRKQVLRPRVIDLNEVVVDMERMLHRLIGEQIEIVVRLASEPVPVRADLGQMQQVVLNLAVNARDAMPQGGTFTIETGVAGPGAAPAFPSAGAPTVPPKKLARLTISDTGVGMTERVRERLFEPFFTTKEMGQATGLGLATVYGIVQQSRGTITVQSKPGEGSVFTISLPLVDEPIEPPAEPVSASPPARGTETVLLVEDEQIVRRLTSKILSERGYQVLEAPGGEEALRVASAFTGPIHVLATDVIMPGMNGRQLADRLLASRPGTRILYISGYAEDALGEAELPDDVLFLQKPFTPEQLLARIRDLLEASPA
jgi:two-component system cell cycle sensor histidine kinase/response regulator CckA